MSGKVDSPLAPYKEKIDATKSEIETAIKSLDKIIYPSVRKYLKLSGRNYEKGLDELWRLLNTAILVRAIALQDELKKKRIDLPIEYILTRHWSIELSQAYQIIERFRRDFIDSQVESNLPSEMYLWLYDMADSIKTRKDLIRPPIVFQESTEFANRTMEYMIRSELQVFEDIAKTPLVNGTLMPAPPPEEGETIDKAHIILYISGESRRVNLWPAIAHEVFHILQSEANWIGSFEEFCINKGVPNVTLNDNQYLNRSWMEEIMMDMLSLSYFGPMFSFSLTNYLQMLPYPSTSTYPPMSYRLYMIQKHLETLELMSLSPKAKKNPILEHCIPRFRSNLTQFVNATDRTLSAKRQELDKLYEALAKWQNSLDMKTFSATLDEYENDVTDHNPKLEYTEIRDYVFKFLIPPAIHPCILLNVVLAEFDSYVPEKHYQVIVDSIKNWKVAQTWKKLKVE